MNTGDSFEGNTEAIPMTAAERNSKVIGLRRQYDHNKQLIAKWREYGRLARDLRREYRGMTEEAMHPAMMANWITASSLSENALEYLQECQFDIESLINDLTGQEIFPDGES